MRYHVHVPQKHNSAAWLAPQRVSENFPQKSLMPDEQGFLRLYALECYDGIAFRAIERRSNFSAQPAIGTGHAPCKPDLAVKIILPSQSLTDGCCTGQIYLRNGMACLAGELKR